MTGGISGVGGADRQAACGSAQLKPAARDVGDPARIPGAFLLLLGGDGKRIGWGDEPEHVPAVKHAELHRVGRDAEAVGHAYRERGRNPGADLRPTVMRPAGVISTSAKAGSEPLPKAVLTQARPTP
jgi:hypothetical protein